jgi:hypothetical protein
VPGRKVHHYRGVKQGDPLSPMLFLLTMEPLHMLFKKAQEAKLINELSPKCDSFRVSLCAEAAAPFLNPAEEELVVMNHILKLFADASGLQTNLSKTQFFPVQCQEVDPDFLARDGQPVSLFPCSYLGLPLHTRKLNRAALQPFIQKIGNRLPGWKRRFMSYPGRELLVKSVLSAMPIHFIIIFKPPKWFILGVDKFRRGFLWRGGSDR